MTGSRSKVKTYATAVALRAALDERARLEQRQTGQNLQLVRRRYAFEAFLRRVPQSGQPLVLKGGYLMHLRGGAPTRFTRDLDATFNDAAFPSLAPALSVERLATSLQAVATVAGDDFFSFQVSSPKQDLGFDREFVGCRFSITALLDGRPFDTFQVDCTAGDALVAPLARTAVGAAFAFAGLAPVMLDSISAAQHLAEKLHAICRDRGARQNNRVKDLYDVVVLQQQGVTAEGAAEVVREVFRLVGNTDVARLEAPVPAGWRDNYDSMARENHLSVDFELAVLQHRTLCDALLRLLRA